MSESTTLRAQAPAPRTEPQTPDEPLAPPPFLSSWRNVYALVLGELLVSVVLFWLLTRWAS